MRLMAWIITVQSAYSVRAFEYYFSISTKCVFAYRTLTVVVVVVVVVVIVVVVVVQSVYSAQARLRPGRELGSGRAVPNPAGGHASFSTNVVVSIRCNCQS